MSGGGRYGTNANSGRAPFPPPGPRLGASETDPRFASRGHPNGPGNGRAPASYPSHHQSHRAPLPPPRPGAEQSQQNGNYKGRYPPSGPSGANAVGPGSDGSGRRADEREASGPGHNRGPPPAGPSSFRPYSNRGVYPDQANRFPHPHTQHSQSYRGHPSQHHRQNNPNLARASYTRTNPEPHQFVPREPAAARNGSGAGSTSGEGSARRASYDRRGVDSSRPPPPPRPDPSPTRSSSSRHHNSRSHRHRSSSRSRSASPSRSRSRSRSHSPPPKRTKHSSSSYTSRRSRSPKRKEKERERERGRDASRTPASDYETGSENDRMRSNEKSSSRRAREAEERDREGRKRDRSLSRENARDKERNRDTEREKLKEREKEEKARRDKRSRLNPPSPPPSVPTAPALSRSSSRQSNPPSAPLSAFNGPTNSDPSHPLHPPPSRPAATTPIATPTGPRAFRERGQIASPSAPSPQQSDAPPPNAPKAMQLQQHAKVSIGLGAAAGQHGKKNFEVKKFFSGDAESDEDELERMVRARKEKEKEKEKEKNALESVASGKGHFVKEKERPRENELSTPEKGTEDSGGQRPWGRQPHLVNSNNGGPFPSGPGSYDRPPRPGAYREQQNPSFPAHNTDPTHVRPSAGPVYPRYREPPSGPAESQNPPRQQRYPQPPPYAEPRAGFPTGRIAPPRSDESESRGDYRRPSVEFERRELPPPHSPKMLPTSEQRTPGPSSPTPPPVISDPSPAPEPAPALVIPAPKEIAPPPTPTINASAEIYERLVQVGEGTYGKVYKARNVETGALVALKRIRMEAEKDGFPVTSVREVKLLQNLGHPNVVELIEMMVSRGHVYMVFEYLDHDLTGVLHHPSIQFTPAHLKSLMKQFLDGLGFIHRRGVLHRDLKGSNILISRTGELKIADFGLARFYARGRGNDYTNRVITQWYKPPELLFGATVYGAEVDMWSAGCIFLELFARKPVFQGLDEIHQLEVIFKTTGTPSVEAWPSLLDLPWYELVKPRTPIPSQLRETYSKWLTPAGLDLAEALLFLDPAGRPTSDEALLMDYFTKEEPAPEQPDILESIKGEWHEYESKRARRKQREEAMAG